MFNVNLQLAGITIDRVPIMAEDSIESHRGDTTIINHNKAVMVISRGNKVDTVTSMDNRVATVAMIVVEMIVVAAIRVAIIRAIRNAVDMTGVGRLGIQIIIVVVAAAVDIIDFL